LHIDASCNCFNQKLENLPNNLSLSGNDLKIQGLKKLSKLLENNTTLTSLNLTGCHITTYGQECLLPGEYPNFKEIKTSVNAFKILKNILKIIQH